MVHLGDQKFSTKFGVIALLYAFAYGRCIDPQPRKEIRELSKLELQKYIHAVNTLHNSKLVDENGLNRLDRFTKIHSDNFPSIHGRSFFLPWHRKYLSEYEKLLQSVDKGVKLPYWDWTLDSRYPHLSMVLSESYMGGNGDVNSNYCLKSGPFANWLVRNPEWHCLPRNFDEGEGIATFTPAEDVNAVLNESRFSDFSYVFEYYHGDTHTGIGGVMGDFSALFSANEPLFFLHHNFVDVVWAEYQMRHKDVVFDGIRYKETTEGSSRLPYYNVTINSVLDTTKNGFCFVDQRYPRALNIPKDSPAYFVDEESEPEPNKYNSSTASYRTYHPGLMKKSVEVNGTNAKHNTRPNPKLILDHLNPEGQFELNLAKVIFENPKLELTKEMEKISNSSNNLAIHRTPPNSHYQSEYTYPSNQIKLRHLQYKYLTDKYRRTIHPSIANLTHLQLIQNYLQFHHLDGKLILPFEADPKLAWNNYLNQHNLKTKLPYLKPLTEAWANKRGFSLRQSQKLEGIRQVFHAILNLDKEFIPFDSGF